MAATFSYAQAAKGLATTTTTGGRNPTAPSEASPNLTPKTSETQVDKPQLSESRSQGSIDSSIQASQSTTAPSTTQDLKPTSPQLNGVSPPASPDYGVSSTSTLVKDDDQSSAVHTSSDSTWENKSQTSAVVDGAGVDAAERISDKDKTKDQQTDAENEAPPAKPLFEAPPPVVNIWKQRAEARAAVQPAPSKAANTVKGDASLANKSHSLPEANIASVIKATPSRERKPEAGPGRNHSEPRVMNGRRETEETVKPKRSQGPRATSHEASLSANAPLPPTRDQESWPTPEIATGEERKKQVEKVEKVEKSDKPEEDSAEKRKAGGKNAWTHVPFTPTVVFHTPLPGSGRRGGRGGGRGGREDSSRGSSNALNGVISPADDRKSTSSLIPNGDHPRRSRPDSSVRNSSPTKVKDDVPVPEPIPETAQRSDPPAVVSSTKAAAVNGETSSQPTGHQRRFSVDRAANTNGVYPSRGGARGRGRRGDFGSHAYDRRRDIENASVISDQAASLGQTSTSTVPQESSDRRKKSISEDAFGSVKQPPSDRRGSTFSSYTPREKGEPRTRGSMRGRGGSHHFQAAQQFGGQQYPGTPGSIMQQAYGFPTSGSPPGWSQGQPGPFYAPQSQHSRNYRNGNQRAQSIPTEMGFGPYSGSYGALPPHIAPLQTHMGYQYDAQAAVQSMSATPFSPYADQYSLFAMVATQLEYYFSMDNLIKDVYLRRHMDSQGFVYLSVIANFSRMKKLTTDLELIKYACAGSRSIEWRVGGDGKDRLRPIQDWQKWVMPMEERDSSARNEGPTDLMMPTVPMPQGFDPYSMHMRHSIGNAVPQSAAAAAAPWQQMNGGRLSHSQSPMSPDAQYGHQFPPQAQQPMPNGFDGRDQYPTGSSVVNGASHSMDPEADTFSDVQAAGLMVVIGKSNGERDPASPSAERTFSNGSIDGKELAESSAETSQPQESQPVTNGDDSKRGRADLPGTEHAPSTSRDSNTSVDSARLCWIKSDDRPVNMIPGPQETERYPILRAQALQERQDAPEGVCPHNLIVLYQFWSHFLLRNFNTTMYNEFRHLALQDYHERQTDVGYSNLLKYYQQALASSDRQIRERVARHYVNLVQAERTNDNDQERIALKQLRTQWLDTTTDSRNRFKLTPYIDDGLKAALEQ